MTAQIIADIIKRDPAHAAHNTLMHCHVRGVHSFVVAKINGKLQRMFFATEEHELWHNEPADILGLKHRMSCGFHAHHCDIEIRPVLGTLMNWMLEPNARGALVFKQHVFRSHILTGRGGFFDTGVERQFDEQARRLLTVGDKYGMFAHEIHTIYVPKGEQAAWLVIEGDEDPNYMPYTFGNDDLESEDFKGMYQRATESVMLDIAEALCR